MDKQNFKFSVYIMSAPSTNIMWIMPVTVHMSTEIWVCR